MGAGSHLKNMYAVAAQCAVRCGLTPAAGRALQLLLHPAGHSTGPPGHSTENSGPYGHHAHCYMFSSFKKLASDGFATVNATLKEANSTLKEAGAAMREPQPSTCLLELDEAIVAGKKAALAANRAGDPAKAADLVKQYKALEAEKAQLQAERPLATGTPEPAAEASDTAEGSATLETTTGTTTEGVVAVGVGGASDGAEAKSEARASREGRVAQLAGGWLGGLTSKGAKLAGAITSLPSSLETSHQSMRVERESMAEQAERQAEAVGSDAARAPWEALTDAELPFAAEIRAACEQMVVEAIESRPKREALFFASPPGVAEFDFAPEVMMSAALACLQADPNLEKLRFALVPRKLREEIFWRNYFYHVDLIKGSFVDEDEVNADHTASPSSMAAEAVVSRDMDDGDAGRSDTAEASDGDGAGAGATQPDTSLGAAKASEQNSSAQISNIAVDDAPVGAEEALTEIDGQSHSIQPPRNAAPPPPAACSGAASNVLSTTDWEKEIDDL
jgi:hypothetical protein